MALPFDTQPTNAPSSTIATGILPCDCRMLVVGDSHSKFWSGNDAITAPDRIAQISTFGVGPALTYNLSREGGTVAGADRASNFIDLAASKGPLPDYLMFSFGEIDIRAHVVRRAIASNLSLADAVAAVTRNYLLFLDAMRRFERPILIWGPPAAQADGLSFNPRMPVAGPEIERNAATALFHHIMAEATANTEGMTFISILEQLMLPGNRTNRVYHYDGAHLGQVAMPLAMTALEEATGWRPPWKPSRYKATLYPGIFETPLEQNVAPDGSWRMLPRNLTAGAAPLAASPGDRVAATSGPQTDPSMTIDLRSLRPIREILLDLGEGSASDHDAVELSVSGDLRHYEAITSETRSIEGAVQRFHFPDRPLRSFRVLKRGKAQTLTVAGIEVRGLAYIAPGTAKNS